MVNYNDKAIIRIAKRHLIKIFRLVFEFVTGFILTPRYDYFNEKKKICIYILKQEGSPLHYILRKVLALRCYRHQELLDMSGT